MSQELAFVLCFCCGVVLVAGLCARAVLRLRLPWLEALMWFGIIGYPEEATYAGLDARSYGRRRLRSHPRPASAQAPSRARGSGSRALGHR